MELLQISQPDQGKINYQTLLERYQTHSAAILNYAKAINYPVYLPWEKARFKAVPTGFTAEEAWFLARRILTTNKQELPIKTPAGTYFWWSRLEYTDEYLNQFDLLMGGQFMTHKVRISASEHQTFLARGAIEEAIASSQLEGASVTRKQAKDMLAENRTPRDKPEWMIHNNYAMMTKITDTYKDVPLSLELLLEMHRLLAANTMKTDEIGRLRTDDDHITVGPDLEPLTTYIPPKRDFLERELKHLIDFANDEDPNHFMHPIIKAIVLHFWLAYLHPFVDGNGRMARALFYWMLLKKNYWLCTYVPISTIIKRAPMQYSNAYVYAEQDNSDFTYFYDYHMQKIKTALDEFLAYVEKQRQENAEVDRLLESRAQLNDRQKQIMHYLLSSPKHRTSVTSHRSLNNISLNTARHDLLDLQKHGLVFAHRQGRFVYYYAKPLG